MSTVWISGAERLGDGSIGGAMDTPDKPGRVVWHTTESGAGDAAFTAVGKYLITEGYEPHILYDPITDRIAQYGPLNESARALQNDGTTRTNRTGKVCIQIEVLAKAGTPFTGYWKPGPNFRALMAAIRSWSIPDVFPMPLADHYGDASKRDRAVWLSQGGHYGHSNVPGNSHWDPGAISTKAIFAAAPVAVAPKPVTSKPVVDLSNVQAAAKADPKRAQGKGLHESDVKPVEAALHKAGLLASSYTGDGYFGSKTVAAYAAWQRHLGYSGSAANGIPGKASLVKLGAKYGFTVKA
jgi:hypothetical protein